MGPGRHRIPHIPAPFTLRTLRSRNLCTLCWNQAIALLNWTRLGDRASTCLEILRMLGGPSQVIGAWSDGFVMFGRRSSLPIKPENIEDLLGSNCALAMIKSFMAKSCKLILPM